MFSEHCFCEKHKFQSNPKNFMQKIKNLFPLEINKLYISGTLRFGDVRPTENSQHLWAVNYGLAFTGPLIER